MLLTNPAIANRRIYLLDPKTARCHRLNDVDAYQDAPCWGASEGELFYVELRDERLHLMVANPAAGIGRLVPKADAPFAGTVGYYGQADWDDLLQQRSPGK